MARYQSFLQGLSPQLTPALFLSACRRVLGVTVGSATFLATFCTATASHADTVMGMELSPAVCHLYPNFASLRQCSEGKPISVSYFATGMQGRCSSQILLALSPLQEKVTARVIPDPYMRQRLWQDYGVCSGLTASSYFRRITTAFNAFKLPNEILLKGHFRVNHASFLQQILTANPSLSPQSMRLFCQAGSNGLPTLTHLNVCYNSAGKYSQCTAVRPTNCPSSFYIDGK